MSQGGGASAAINRKITFLQKPNFETKKRNLSARLPSKTTLLRWKTKHFCEASSKIEFEPQKQKISARLPSKLKLWSSKTKLFCETSCKNEPWVCLMSKFIKISNLRKHKNLRKILGPNLKLVNFANFQNSTNIAPTLRQHHPHIPSKSQGCRSGEPYGKRKNYK